VQRAQRWYLLALAGVTAIILAVPVAAQQPLTLSLWHMEARPTRVKAIEEMADAFNRSQQGVRVKVEVQSWADVYMKIAAAVTARRPPEMMFTSPDLTMDVALTGTVQDVSAEVNMMKRKYKVYDAALAPFSVSGKYRSIPLYNMAEVLWYRTDLFQKAGLDPRKPPKTWSELLNTAAALTKSGVVKYAIGVAGDWHLATVQQIYPLMVTAKAQDILDGQGNVAFDNPNTVRAFDMYLKLFKLSPPGSETWQWDQAIAALVGGEIAMVIEKGQYNEQWALRTKLDPTILAAAPVPIPDQDGQRGTATWMNGIMLLNGDPKIRPAFTEFIEYLLKPENMVRVLAVAPGFFLPVTEEAAKAPQLLGNPTIKAHFHSYDVMMDESKYGKQLGFTREPYHRYVGRITGQNLIALAAQGMIHEGLSPQAAVRRGADRMREALR
jgi:ABC-type glycerol-3-phosphate transport system substrate-binding protein